MKKGGLSLMSDELERKRQERIANFRLDLDLDSGDADPAETDAGAAGSVTENERTFAAENSSEEGLTETDSSELKSYSSMPVSGMATVDKKSLKRAKKTDRKRRRKKAKKNRTVFRIVWIAMVVFISVMIGEFIMVGVNDMLGVGREQEGKVTITIPENADLNTITDILYDSNVINEKWIFKLYATMTKATSGFTQGTFEIEKNKDYQALINYMQSDMNRTDVVTIRFTEGMSLKQYAKLLNDAKVCKADEFLAACNSDRYDEYEFIKNIPNADKREIKLEGYLFPDTYDFYVGEKVDSVIEKFLSNYRRKIYGTKSRVAGYDKKMTVAERAETIGMSMEDVLTLASLIQAEAANKDDMYMISAILHNRLATIPNDGVNANGESGLAYLQLDSTKYYPYASLQDIPLDIRSTFKSKYNTYDIEGLPPGPINNPGLEAIEAALTVGKTDNYYFCHKSATDTEPAVAYYAKTMEEHIENLKKAGLKP